MDTSISIPTDVHADSPFDSLSPDQLDDLCSSTGFQILRQYLHLQGFGDFCGRHAAADLEVQSKWLLHRDILHALTMPVVQLFAQASALAYAALCTKNPDDLELAFRGEARSAFLWLQCFLGEEEDWCHTKGCPACITQHILFNEHTIRATLTAAQLSAPSDESRSASPSASNVDVSSPSLPDFSAILPALEVAVNNDPFWGPGTFANLLARASRVTIGIHDLMSQCTALEALVTSAPPSPGGRLEQRRGSLFNALYPAQDDDVDCAIDDRFGKEMRLKRSKLAKRQMRMKEEQKAMIMRMAWQCWSAVQFPAEQRMALRASARKGSHGPRRRTSTCP